MAINNGRDTGHGKEIKMNFEEVAHVLDQMGESIALLKLPMVYNGINGQNQLEFLEEWTERESQIRSFLIQYIAIVEQSIADTKANAQLLKDQDEAIGRK